MAALHQALRSLGPVAFDEVPTEPDALRTYMSAHFAQAQLISESVPPPPPLPSSKDTKARARSDTVTSASSAADLTTVSASSEALIAEHAELQTEWGKPLKLSAKDNPLGMAVYKLAAKDGRGAWFARRSVHEGLSFDKWKTALLREFPESMEVQGAPGEGNVRGIGGESRLEHVEIEGLGTMQVLRLSAQFPGPTTPRDFVTLILTSSDALRADEQRSKDPYASNTPRHLITISKPCLHSGAEPQPNFIRGSYESIEIIRELPSRRKKHSLSASDLPQSRASGPGLAKDAIVRRAQASSVELKTVSSPGTLTTSPPLTPSTRKRGSTVAGMEPADYGADPVEWVMVTRSEPGGSVPRFMVERGTPSSICADAKKFLDWACGRDFGGDTTYGMDERQGPIALQRNATLAGIVGESEAPRRPRSLSPDSDVSAPALPDPPSPPKTAGLLSSMVQSAYAGFESATHAVGLARSATDPLTLSTPEPAPTTRSSSSSSISSASFASAADYHSDGMSNKSKASAQKTLNPQEKELAKVAALRVKMAALKAKLAADLEKTKEKQVKDQQNMTEREAERVRKAEEKHAREVAKAEERHAKELRNLEAQRRKEERKLIERQERDARREREKIQRDERAELRKEVAALTTERDLLQETCRQLQAENTRLVAAVGKIDGGETVLKDIRSGRPASILSATSKDG